MALDNNPAGEPPVGPTEDEIMDVFSLDDTSSAAAAIAAKAAGEPVPDGGSTPPAPAGDGGSAAPAASPDTPPSAASEEPPAPVATSPAPASPSAAPAAPSAEPGTPSAATTPPPVDEQALREASLKAQNDALQRTIEELRAKPKADETPSSAESGQDGQKPVSYALTLPQSVQEALASGEPDKVVAAITSIVNDFGTIVHNAVLGQVRKEMQAAESRVRAELAGDTRGEAERAARQQYYDAFPAHDNALILPIIQLEGAKMASEFPGLTWDANYINALGARVNAAIAAVSAVAAPGSTPPPPPPPPAPPGRPAAMIPSGPRDSSATTTPELNSGETIAALFDPFDEG